MKNMRAIQVRTSTVKRKFSNRSSGQTVQTEISPLHRNRSDKGLHSSHSVCTLLQNRNNRPKIVGQGLAVLAAGTGWKLFDSGGYIFNFNNVRPRNETVNFLLFGIFL